LGPLLERIARRGVPLLIHPGPAPGSRGVSRCRSSRSFGPNLR
jgi:hypothetical protein